MAFVLTLASAGFALAAAFLWWRGSTVAIPYKPVTDADGWTSAAIISKGNGKEIDVLASSAAASRLNAWGAGCAVVSAIFSLGAAFAA